MEIINSSEITDEYYDYLELEKTDIVSQVLKEVKQSWDIAVNKYTQQFDNLDLENTLISRIQIEEAYKQVSQEDIDILKEAAANIEFFAKEQFKCKT